MFSYLVFVLCLFLTVQNKNRYIKIYFFLFGSYFSCSDRERSNIKLCKTSNSVANHISKQNFALVVHNHQTRSRLVGLFHRLLHYHVTFTVHFQKTSNYTRTEIQSSINPDTHILIRYLTIEFGFFDYFDFSYHNIL